MTCICRAVAMSDAAASGAKGAVAAAAEQAKAEGKLNDARAELERAKTDLKDADARLDKAKADLKAAVEGKDADFIVVAKRGVDTAQKGVDEAQEMVTFYARLVRGGMRVFAIRGCARPRHIDLMSCLCACCRCL